MTAEPNRVVMADDHPRLRAHIRQALEAGGFEVCAEAANGPEAVRLAQQHQPDVVLLDIHMPGGGIRAAAEVARLMPEVAIVMLTVSRDDNDLFDSLRAGASGYLLKNSAASELFKAIEEVSQGRSYVTPLATQGPVGSLAHSPGPARGIERLSTRQREVMQCWPGGARWRRSPASWRSRPGPSPSTSTT